MSKISWRIIPDTNITIWEYAKCVWCILFEYEWSFEDNDTRNDVVVDDILLIDRINELYLTGMELDYKQEIFGANFVFNNPMAKSSCGCGTSFSV